MNNWIAANWDAPNSIIAGTTTRSTNHISFPFAGKPCWMNQIHGNSVIRANQYNDPPEADGCISEKSEYFCVVQTADCLPVLFCSSDGNSYAAAHAGWRGLAEGILENVVAKFLVDASQIIVWLGPAISQLSFEVGKDVRDKFIDLDPAYKIYFILNKKNHWFCDIYGLARHKLKALGISKIFGGDYCTFNDKNLFYSYRRDLSSKRMISFVGLKCP